jgi:AbiV family abortive infection protein
MSRKDPILSKKECEELIFPSLIHANELKQCSLQLYENEHYSVAFSLYILSMEEISKAFMCYYGAMGFYSVRKSNLTSHVTKQKFLSMSLLISTLMKWDQLGNILQVKMKDPKSKPMNMDDIPKEIKNEIEEVLEFLLAANYMKESGFYVDIDDKGELILPNEVITQNSFPSFYFELAGPLEINETVISNMKKLSEFHDLLMDPENFSKLFPKTINQQLSEYIKPLDNKKQE